MKATFATGAPGQQPYSEMETQRNNLAAAEHPPAPCSLKEAMAAIQRLCEPLVAERVPLETALGRVLRESVCAPEDIPACDRSTRDGYAILQHDPAPVFQVVDTLYAADWKPRQLKPGEAVRVATGAALPCAGLRVVMQENVATQDGSFRIVTPETALNRRQRGEDVPAGGLLVPLGTRLNAGKLALLATVGCVQPRVNPRLCVVHLTTGDEVVPPEQTPLPGQIRDSNSILIRSLLQPWPCDIFQTHLPEDFALAKTACEKLSAEFARADMVLISGGASVGEKDFTSQLLTRLGFTIHFSQVNLRPGKPLIFGTQGRRVAFGLPGNPLSHFVCFHFAVAIALARLAGEAPPQFWRGRLAAPLTAALCPRETLWPARREGAGLLPLPWSSSGDVTCFAAANALLRVPANTPPLPAGTEVDFLPADFQLPSILT